MTTQAGLWIDHREANLVLLSETGEKTQQIKSNVEKQLRRSGDSQRPSKRQMAPAADRRERGYMGHLANYYREVLSAIRGADSIFIFGPGEAKGELRKHLLKQHRSERIVGFEAADRMTKRQMSKMVREFYTGFNSDHINGNQAKEANTAD